jgi:Skp family chaperone for outer membrane proteins
MIFAGLFVVSAIAQAPPANAKIALIDTQAFYLEKGGINKLLDGYKRLNAELQPEVNKLEAKLTEFGTLKKSYDTLVDNANKNIPVKAEDVQSKQEKLTEMQTDIKRMQEDLKKKSEKREEEIVNPIIIEIGKSISEYSKQKGYTVVFDIGRLSRGQMVLYVEQTADITDEFIKYYNTKPAGTATK